MHCLTRRELLKMLSILLPASLVKCGKSDVFVWERVCVHIFNHGIAIPEPLLKRYERIPRRNPKRTFFQVGIPELLVCTTPAGLLESFLYFWPLTREEFRQAHRRMNVHYQVNAIATRSDIHNLQTYLQDHGSSLRPRDTKTALVAVLNDYTKFWMGEVMDIWKNSALDEVVILKDPTRPPYLCDYPALQKGFKRPPP
jgi:hypothetical protein